MSRQVSAEDLVVLARQCKLSEEEERRFEIALQSSRELECLYEAGLHFDVEAGVRSGDEKRLDRLVSGALERIAQSREGGERAHAVAAAGPEPARSRRGSPAVRHFAASLGLGMLLCATLASAWDYVEKRAARLSAQEVQKGSRARSGAAAKGPPSPASFRAPAPPPPATDSFAAEPPQAPRPHALGLGPGGVPHKRSVEDAASAGELFARANEARRKGDIEQAISLYERLARVYPSSSEAEDAKILRGNLLLIQRSPRAALREFEDYHSSALSLEALWGRAQALRKLESPDERAILLELVRDHPDSPYAEAAKKRLVELAR